jgi:hypothetical protein
MSRQSFVSAVFSVAAAMTCLSAQLPAFVAAALLEEVANVGVVGDATTAIVAAGTEKLRHVSGGRPPPRPLSPFRFPRFPARACLRQGPCVHGL